MLRMPEFQVHLPETAAEAVALRTQLAESMYVAGGTDLLPNLKHHLHRPSALISLANIQELREIHVGEQDIRIGACSTLHQVALHAELAQVVPALPLAASMVAGPQHRRMGTMGGNVMLDTRCIYYNQTENWRRSLGYCLKKDGDWCHVIGSKATCVAAQSSDSVPVLTALDAQLVFTTAEGEQTIGLDTLYRMNGMDVHTVPDTALLREIIIPRPAEGHRSTYRKVRARGAIDYPQLGLALSATFDGDTCTSLRGVVGAIMPRPKILKKLDAAVGTSLDDATIEAIAEATYKQIRPQSSIHGSPAWRRHMARVEMRRGLKSLREG